MGEEMDVLLTSGSTPFIFKWVLSVIGFNEVWGMDLVSWLPGVVHLGVSLPFDEVLESSSPTGVPVIDDFFNFILFFSFNKVRGWSRIVRTMCSRFTIGQ